MGIRLERVKVDVYGKTKHDVQKREGYTYMSWKDKTSPRKVHLLHIQNHRVKEALGWTNKLVLKAYDYMHALQKQGWEENPRLQFGHYHGRSLGFRLPEGDKKLVKIIKSFGEVEK